MRRIELPIIALLTALVTFGVLRSWHGPMTDQSLFFLCDDFPGDELEYALPAANLALHGEFPVYGFIGPIEDYRLCAQPEALPYFRTLAQAPPIVFPSKPPVYSFLLGFAFEVFGMRPSTVHLLNLWLWALMASLLPIAGAMLRGRWGMYAALAAVPVLLFFSGHHQQLTAEILTKALVMLAAVAGMAAWRGNSPWRHFLFGASMALLVLTKGYFALALAGMMFLYMTPLQKGLKGESLRPLLAFSVGGALLLVPWVLHINTAIQNNIPQRTEFSRALREASPKLMLDNHDDIYDAQGALRHDVVMELLLFHQYQHALENGTVIVTNQLGDYNILNVHNEYCTDGDFHPEWRIISSSFYNGLPEMGKNAKLLRFYVENPLLGLRITWAKLRSGIGGRPWLLLPTLLAMLVMRRKMPTPFMPTAVLVLTILPVLVMFYGDARFVATVDGVCVLMMLTLLRSGNSSV
jgi:4-amino-4-deoxy-L-arabinose transferase-like glycosyltransferase